MSEKSKTTNSQRIIIWIIAIVMAAGTLLTYIVVIVAQNNRAADPTQIAYEKYLASQKEAQNQTNDNCPTSAVINAYEPQKFDENSVKELKVETLKEGDGAVLTAENFVCANYIGYTPDGEAFNDTRGAGGAAGKSIGFALNGVIAGWMIGLTGKKVGGVYRLTIPAAQSYGEKSEDDGSGRPFGPLGFVVEVVSAE